MQSLFHCSHHITSYRSEYFQHGLAALMEEVACIIVSIAAFGQVMNVH
ncbi:Unknown protein sequence [Pseudomonas savastanoi pv. glycinea]|uniref:Uncharacterized protein n=1 Tax=Pseudomonas savastanoi pv. glycinea TaxID=318 RepID=A0A3M4H2H8_PSESG|nr:Unknown protein sequence [Pseudomonas savastanoi pv. glycinea]KPC37508.1 Unknown protein sequence [Pseudomonas savastanoi pv. glycinea]KPC37905.1 Unknown protein sequence [Pseudomonas savastanoi pv. glycinea]KPC55550.1 Unknown protein sequence [Pseudomonas savastanoi pv. glycinea]RML33312.1 hypothetical protein ALQ97_102562 [Pseudomonas savastanoi pv. glycinea]